MYKHLYKRFLAAHSSEIHFACHSHHYWPDVTREAHLQYWDDACKYVDEKWNYFFSVKIPQAQTLIAESLNLSNSSQIVFAPNTHELVFRLLSSFDDNKPLRILTTDSEFYSFDRQINRLTEKDSVEVFKVPTMPFDTFHERFKEKLKEQSWDFVFVSHVFFNSGLVCDFKHLALAAPPESLFVVDGYHGFMALPTDLGPLKERIFYIAGSYKYAQGGEGACFLYVPPSTRHRPLYTGWFAELSNLSSVQDKVGYPENALQYAGSTMDFSALYRLISVLELFKREGLNCSAIHNFIQSNQRVFLQALGTKNHPLLNSQNLITTGSAEHGHFLTFELPSTEATEEIVRDLQSKGIKTDSRGNRLRFGFGLYHEAKDIVDALEKI